jgi:hypothetical protein
MASALRCHATRRSDAGRCRVGPKTQFEDFCPPSSAASGGPARRGICATPSQFSETFSSRSGHELLLAPFLRRPCPRFHRLTSPRSVSSNFLFLTAFPAAPAACGGDIGTAFRVEFQTVSNQDSHHRPTPSPGDFAFPEQAAWSSTRHATDVHMPPARRRDRRVLLDWL